MEIREYKKATRCELGFRFLRCRHPMVGQCQYCARGFCAEHGDRFNEIEEVCHRDSCQTKKHDLQAHLQFKREATARNDRNLCGEPICDIAPVADCQRCNEHYCPDHLSQRMMTVVRGTERQAEIQRICAHCVARLAIWEAS